MVVGSAAPARGRVGDQAAADDAHGVLAAAVGAARDLRARGDDAVGEGHAGAVITTDRRTVAPATTAR